MTTTSQDDHYWPPIETAFRTWYDEMFPGCTNCEFDTGEMFEAFAAGWKAAAPAVAAAPGTSDSDQPGRTTP